MTWKLKIGGRDYETNNKKEIFSPYKKELIGSVCQAGDDEFEMSVNAAQDAFEITKKLPSHERSRVLRRISDILLERKNEISSLISIETGKPITLSKIEMDRAINTFLIASALSLTQEGEILDGGVVKFGENRTILVKRFPLGPVGAITPFNWPLNLVAHKVAAAFAVGNTVVLRPSSSTPFSSLLLADICNEAGAVNGSINVIPSPVRIAEKIVEDSRLKMVSFTGSPEVGWGIKKKCGNKKVALELGGNAAVIIEPETNIDSIIPRLLFGAFGYAGQICISLQRIFVHKKIVNELTEKLIQAASKMKIGDINDPDVICGPLITEKEAIRVESWVDEAVSCGAQILVGGKRDKNLYLPTILSNTKQNMKVNSSEVFGPVVTVQDYDDFKEAIKLVDDTQYGLHTGIYTNDHRKAFYAFDNLDVGGIIINDIPSFRTDNMPYGGQKNSGFGREGVKYTMEEMSDTKYLTF